MVAFCYVQLATTFLFCGQFVMLRAMEENVPQQYDFVSVDGVLFEQGKEYNAEKSISVIAKNSLTYNTMYLKATDTITIHSLSILIYNSIFFTRLLQLKPLALSTQRLGKLILENCTVTLNDPLVIDSDIVEITKSVIKGSLLVDVIAHGSIKISKSSIEKLQLGTQEIPFEAGWHIDEDTKQNMRQLVRFYYTVAADQKYVSRQHVVFSQKKSSILHNSV